MAKEEDGMKLKANFLMGNFSVRELVIVDFKCSGTKRVCTDVSEKLQRCHHFRHCEPREENPQELERIE